jgi:uncharacterized protein YdeI (YjbR/CyaY-like superfamily)
LGENVIEPIFFESPEHLRAWFEQHHTDARELLVGFYKKGVDLKGISYNEALNQALCFGWIDTTVRSIDDRCYARLFTPRKKQSYWSAVNIAKAEELIATGQMHESGLRTFEERDRSRALRYSFEQPADPELDAEAIVLFKANETAWAFFERQSAGYKKRIIWWVISAKKPETRQRRLESLITSSAEGKQIS